MMMVFMSDFFHKTSEEWVGKKEKRKQAKEEMEWLMHDCVIGSNLILCASIDPIGEV